MNHFKKHFVSLLVLKVVLGKFLKQDSAGIKHNDFTQQQKRIIISLKI